MSSVHVALSYRVASSKLLVQISFFVPHTQGRRECPKKKDKKPHVKGVREKEGQFKISPCLIVFATASAMSAKSDCFSAAWAPLRPGGRMC